ncbi:MAG TPA: hypothetical protein DDY17_04215 [Syntrophaceae bacterium]|jgi:hypothetical protein|nr:hypothetical protein [Syntrophaceae bacterium]
MKKEGKHRKDKIKKIKSQEESLPDADFGNDEYGFEYDFFITTNNENIEKKLSVLQPRKKEKVKDTEDQSKTFFLPDFFVHED